MGGAQVEALLGGREMVPDIPVLLVSCDSYTTLGIYFTHKHAF